MLHQKDCYRLGVVSYSSDPSGDCFSPLVGVPESTLRHYDRVAGHATTQHDGQDGPRLRQNMIRLDDSFRHDGNLRNRSRVSGHTARIV